MSDTQEFLDKCQQFGLKVSPEDDYKYGSISYLSIEFPDHTKFWLRPDRDYDDYSITAYKEK